MTQASSNSNTKNQLQLHHATLPKRARPLNIMMAAIEPSADMLGAALFQELKKTLPEDTKFWGCGGIEMHKAGFESDFDVAEFAVMGFTDVAKVIPSALNRSRELAMKCAMTQCDIAIFVDGWTFSRFSAKRIKLAAPHTKIVKYVAPQVWASRPQRIDFVKDHFDLVLALLPFEPPIFQAKGIDTAYVGNPHFEHVLEIETNTDQFKKKYNLTDAPILAVLPGSRKGEVKRLCPVYGEVMTSLMVDFPDLQCIIPIAPAVQDMVEAQITAWQAQGINIIGVDTDERYNVFKAANASLSASGTVTTEVALCQTPQVITYKVDALTYFWAQRVMQTEFASILNIMENQEIIPEFLQHDFKATLITPVLKSFLTDPDSDPEQQKLCAGLPEKLLLNDQSIKAAKRAAATIIDRFC